MNFSAKQFSWIDYSPVANPSDMNYNTTDKCDDCGKIAPGTMLHAAGATGRVCPVLFLCNNCNTH